MTKSELNLSCTRKEKIAGQERILLVDDEKLLTRMWTKILGRKGYKITAVNSAADAIELFTAAPDQFDLIVTDLCMPEITGDMLSKAILTIRPDIPVILCTGYSSRIEQNPAIAASFRKIIIKPAKIAEMATAIRDALDGK